MEVLFIIEHPDRELAAVEAIAQELRNKYGISSFIGSSQLHFGKIVRRYWRRSPAVVVYPALRRTDRSMYYQLFRKEAVHLSLQWEQLLHKGSRVFRTPRDHDLDLKEKVHHIAWDEKFKSFLIENGVRAEHVHITGNPNLALLYQMVEKKDVYRKVIAKRFGIDPQKVWIFFPMNYVWAFFTPSDIEFRRKEGYPEVILQEFPRYARSNIESFFYLVRQLVKFANDYQLIVRPHPSVLGEQYQQLYSQIVGEQWPKSAVLTHELSAREWVAAADFVGSSWSTVAYDAWRVGKPSFLFLPFAVPDWLKVEWYDELPKVSSIEDLRVLVEEKRYELPDRKIEDINALSNIARVVAELANSMDGSPRKIIWQKRWAIIRKNGIPIIKLLVKGLIINAYGLSRWKKISRYKRDYFKPIFIGRMSMLSK